MSWCPVSYPKLSSAVIESTNLLLSRKPPIRLQSGSETYSIRAFPAESTYNTRLVLSIDIGGATALAYFSPALLDSMLADLMPTQHFQTLEDELKLAVLEDALGASLAALTEFLQTPVTLGQVVDGTGSNRQLDPADSCTHQSFNTSVDLTPTIANRLQFEVGRQWDSVCFNVQIELLSALPEPVRARLAKTHADRRHDLGHLPVPVMFELGETALTVSALKSLEPGDIILFDESYIARGMARVNIASWTHLLANVDEYSLTVQSRQYLGAVRA